MQRARWRLWDAGYLLLAIVALLWAGNSIVGRAVRDLVPPATLAFVRWTGALLLVIGFAWAPLRRDAATVRRHWPILLILGLLGVAAFNTLLYTGLGYTTATNGLLLQSAIPPLILALGALLFRDRATPAQAIASAFSLGGVLVIVARGAPDTLLHLHLNRGDALIATAVLAWAFYTLLLRYRPDIHPLSFLAVTFAIGVMATAPIALREMVDGGLIVWSAVSIGALFYVAVFPSLIAYLAFNRGVELIGAARASAVLNLMPLFGTVLAVPLLGERLAGFHVVGMAMIIIGVASFAWASRGLSGTPATTRSTA